MFGFADYSVNS